MKRSMTLLLLLGMSPVVAWCKSLQPGCFIGFNHGDQEGADIRLGEMGRPGPLDDPRGAGPYMKNAPSRSYLLAEFTYPILPPHQGGAMWFYSLPKHDALCHSAEKLYKDYLGAVKYGNIFSLDVGPDHEGRLRKIDVETLQRVGQMIRNPPPLPPPPLTIDKKATASSTWPQSGFEAGKAVDGDETTRWDAAADARSGWLEVDLGRETLIGRAVIKELGYHRTQKFTIEWKDGATWKELARGTAIAGEKEIRFQPVAARHVRLTILEASEVPTIEEFDLYSPPPAAK